MKRTFIAIKIPLEKHKQEIISDIQKGLKEEKIKWVDTWNMHVTLFFLGDTEINVIPDIINEISAQLKDVKSFQLKLDGLGVFKSIREPKVVWIGIEESISLKKIKERIDQSVEYFGFNKDNRTFKPHLTLGRIKFIQDKSNLKDVLDNFADQDFGTINVKQVMYYESTLTPKGPIYKVIKQFDLD